MSKSWPWSGRSMTLRLGMGPSWLMHLRPKTCLHTCLHALGLREWLTSSLLDHNADMSLSWSTHTSLPGYQMIHGVYQGSVGPINKENTVDWRDKRVPAGHGRLWLQLDPGLLDQGDQVIELNEGEFINPEALSDDAGFTPWQGPQHMGLICLCVDSWMLGKSNGLN